MKKYRVIFNGQELDVEAENEDDAYNKGVEIWDSIDFKGFTPILSNDYSEVLELDEEEREDEEDY